MTEKEFSSWIIDLKIPKKQESFRIRLDERLILGRKDNTQQTKDPDVDLTPFDAESEGVSRHHAQIHIVSDKLMVTDLNSGNGTFLNGVRLDAEKAYPLKHDDSLRLGNLELIIGIVISPNYGSSVHTQTSIQVQDQSEPGKGQLVLIVEDDPAVSKLLALMLGRAGYTSVVSYDVIGAMRLFKQRKPSAVILDLMLPDMNGLELCRFIRRDTEQNTTPVIVISAAKTQERIEQSMQAGADIFLGKPLSSKELRHVVGSLINRTEKGASTLKTKHLVGTAPLHAIEPESRRDAAVLFVAGNNNPITLRLRQPVSLGRQATNSARAVNHVDLSRFEAVELGVSREHAQLSYRDDQFFVRDMGSTNGTFVNGEPIKANTERQLYNADEIRLGQLRMYIYFLTDSERAAEAVTNNQQNNAQIETSEVTSTSSQPEIGPHQQPTVNETPQKQTERLEEKQTAAPSVATAEKSGEEGEDPTKLPGITQPTVPQSETERQNSTG